jgi:hypothetical protein
MKMEGSNDIAKFPHHQRDLPPGQFPVNDPKDQTEKEVAS